MHFQRGRCCYFREAYFPLFGDTADDDRGKLAADIIAVDSFLAQRVCYLTGVVSGLSLVSRTKTASSFAGSVLLALRLIEWVAPGGSDQLSPAR